MIPWLAKFIDAIFHSKWPFGLVAAVSILTAVYTIAQPQTEFHCSWYTAAPSVKVRGLFYYFFVCLFRSAAAGAIASADP